LIKWAFGEFWGNAKGTLERQGDVDVFSAKFLTIDHCCHNCPMPRQARLDAPGALHHIMVRGIDKTDIFRDDQDKARFLERLGENVTEGKCFVYAWVLMDNHVHLLFKSGKYVISAVIRKLLTWYAQYFNRRHKRTGHLFQNRYKSILCDEDSYFLALVRYSS
jgi:REP element-mobilizing transposase RayT